jgi:hypothetical protein
MYWIWLRMIKSEKEIRKSREIKNEIEEVVLEKE